MLNLVSLMLLNSGFSGLPLKSGALCLERRLHYIKIILIIFNLLLSFGKWILSDFYSSASFSSVQPLSCVWLFSTPWTAACQASLSFAISQSLLRLTSIQSVMLSNHLILCCPLLLWPSIFPSSFPMSWLFSSGSQSIRASPSASVLPMNIQGWFPLRLTDLTSLLFKYYLG